jgi:hypothetical protein
MRASGLAVVAVVATTALVLSASFFISLRHSTVATARQRASATATNAGWNAVGSDAGGDSFVVAQQREQITRLLQQVEVREPSHACALDTHVLLCVHLVDVPLVTRCMSHGKAKTRSLSAV